MLNRKNKTYGIAERYYTTDAETRLLPGTSSKESEDLRRADSIHPESLQDEDDNADLHAPIGSQKKLLYTLPSGNYGLESNVGTGEVYVYQYNQGNNALNLGETFGVKQVDQGFVKPKGPSNTFGGTPSATGDRCAATIRSIDDAQRKMWQRNAPAPKPLPKNFKHSA